MTNGEIVTKMIEEAEERGWKNDKNYSWCERCTHLIWNDRESESDDFWHTTGEIEAIVFNHDFAKAYWGVSGEIQPTGQQIIYKEWQYHLTQMVLESEPLKYIEKFLNA